MVNQFYAERKNLGTKVLVISDMRSNSLIVRAQARDLEEIAALIRKIDRDGSDSMQKVKFFPLKNALATDLAAVMNSAIQSVLAAPSSGGGGGGGQGGQGPVGLNTKARLVISVPNREIVAWMRLFTIVWRTPMGTAISGPAFSPTSVSLLTPA